MGILQSSPSKNAIKEILGELTSSQRGKVKKELKSYDIVLIANNTKSMENICKDDDVRDTLVNLAKIADALDCDGFDLHLVNGSQKYNLQQRGKDQDAIAKLLKDMPFLDGGLSLSDKLRELVNAYKETPRKKKMNYIVLLSECNHEQKGKLQEFIEETVTWMQATKLSPRQIGFQFVQIGNNRQTRGILHHLDAQLKQPRDTKTWDIVDRTTLRAPNATIIVKILLGGILRRVDDNGAGALLGPNWFLSIWREDPSKLMKKQMQLLVDYDTVVLVDDSATMSEANWQTACDALDMLINLTGERDTDGIDVHFVNHDTRFEGLKTFFRPQGNASLKVKLESLVDQYLDEISEQLSKGETPGKPVNYIVITNGIGLKDQGMKEFVIETAGRLDTKQFEHKKTIGIQFLQIGNDKQVTKFFNELDDTPEAKLDIVDTTLYQDVDPILDDTVAKALLGGISQKFDDKPRKSHTFQSNIS
ncbi:hypothetical protein BDN72DRAFT_895148 [Pluteus cervinus]|uniref:Uncharacterized protein n=1 Tax=Pluteus cervinus TaxID=181527 RepID=A0ACD3B2A6_9AGAR|nr:hypothetical protein BDN72DRAFT_895148 [Pluteus cervinus]